MWFRWALFSNLTTQGGERAGAISIILPKKKYCFTGPAFYRRIIKSFIFSTTKNGFSSHLDKDQAGINNMT